MNDPAIAYFLSNFDCLAVHVGLSYKAQPVLIPKRPGDILFYRGFAVWLFNRGLRLYQSGNRFTLRV